MSDLEDRRQGAYDPVNKKGAPQPDQIDLKATPHQQAQNGADVRPEPNLVTNQNTLPEGLRRPARGPYGRTGGRHGEQRQKPRGDDQQC